jgi:hypothetical protein
LINTDVKKRLAKGYKDILKGPSMNISVNPDQEKVKQAPGLVNLGNDGEFDSIRQIVSKYNSAYKESRHPTTTTKDFKKNNSSLDSSQTLAAFQPTQTPEIQDPPKPPKPHHGFFSKSPLNTDPSPNHPKTPTQTTPNPDPNSLIKVNENSIQKINQILAKNHKIINKNLVSLQNSAKKLFYPQKCRVDNWYGNRSTVRSWAPGRDGDGRMG